MLPSVAVPLWKSEEIVFGARVASTAGCLLWPEAAVPSRIGLTKQASGRSDLLSRLR